MRAGSILPLGPVRQYVDEPVDQPLVLRVYPGTDATTHVFEDDGRSFAYRRGEWTGLNAAWDESAKRLTVRLADGSKQRGGRRRIACEIAGLEGNRTIEFDGRPVSVPLARF